MRTKRTGVVGAIAGVLLGGLVATVGCMGPDDEVSAEAAELHRRHHSPDAGNVGGAAGMTGRDTGGTNGATAVNGGAAADCDICTQAQQCCSVLEGHPQCSFSAVTCASMVGDARPAYVNACLTFVMAVRGVWSGNPPAECR